MEVRNSGLQIKNDRVSLDVQLLPSGDVRITRLLPTGNIFMFIPPEMIEPVCEFMLYGWKDIEKRGTLAFSTSK